MSLLQVLRVGMSNHVYTKLDLFETSMKLVQISLASIQVLVDPSVPCNDVIKNFNQQLFGQTVTHCR